MKITIDTKEDSHEELRKVIKMLSSLVGDEVMSNQGDLFGDSSTQTGSSNIVSDDNNKTEGSDMFSMFNSGSESTPSSEDTTKETTEVKKEENDEIDIDLPDVREYH